MDVESLRCAYCPLFSDTCTECVGNLIDAYKRSVRGNLAAYSTAALAEIRDLSQKNRDLSAENSRLRGLIDKGHLSTAQTRNEQ